MKINILIDNNHSFLNLWKKEIKEIITKFKHRSKLFINQKDIKKGDVLLILGCEKILQEEKLKLHKLNLVIHPSKLPSGRGGAALIWSILNNKKKFFLTMFNANEKIDRGDIVFVQKFSLKGHELHDEIRTIQAQQTIKLIIKFLKNIHRIKLTKQKGLGSYLKRRKIESTITSKFKVEENVGEDLNGIFANFMNFEKAEEDLSPIIERYMQYLKEFLNDV
jgi:methionyl-tRNA formyltransferase